MSSTPVGEPGTLARLGHDSVAPRSTGGAPSWPVRQKVSIPTPSPGHFPRPDLVERCLPTHRRVTVLRAPAGFGKTVLLAECCRELTASGVLTAWLSVDEQDEPEQLAAHLTQAFLHAGLDPPDHADGLPQGTRIAQLLQAIEAREAPCVLALDEVERIGAPGSVTLVNILLERSPANLHLAIACRHLPGGLEVGTSILDGEAIVVTARQLRFSTDETAAFLSDTPAGGQAAASAADAAGWPVALRIHRETRFGAPRAAAARDFAQAWLASRMRRAIPESDRCLVLDAGLLDRLEPRLVEEVVGAHDAWRRLQAMEAIDGLLLPEPETTGEVYRMHPLLRDWCRDWRRRETPERFREVHGRIARALSRRGSVVNAMRHAAEGDDPELAASILAEAGGLRFMLREGHARLQAADRFLPPNVLVTRPRLALARCAVLAVSGRQDEARRLYATVPEPSPGSGSGAEGSQQRDLYLDRLFVRAALFGTAGGTSAEAASVANELAQALRLPAVDPMMRAAFEYVLCVLHESRAAFEEAVACADRARKAMRHEQSYLATLVDFQLGAIEMVRGHPDEAVDWYQRARHAVQTASSTDPGARGLGEVLARELDLERHGPPRRHEPAPLPADSANIVSPFPLYAAASDAAVEFTLHADGVDGALAVLQQSLDESYRKNLPALSRYLSIRQVSLLAEAGRGEQARRAWRIAGLPEDDDACLDLERQSWREMEALVETRLRLFCAEGRFQHARRFGRTVAEATERLGLRRTRMRCLALSINVEAAAGKRQAAVQHLAEFVRLFVESDYAAPLLRECQITLPLVNDYMPGADEPARASAARELLERLQRAANGSTALTQREWDILRRLQHERDRDIARALGISHGGVRYHVRKVFDKLGASNRTEAVYRARLLGLLPEQRDR